MTPSSLLEQAVNKFDPDGRWSDISGLAMNLHIGGNILASRFQSSHTRGYRVDIDTRPPLAVLDPFFTSGTRGVFAGDSIWLENAREEVQPERSVNRVETGEVVRMHVWDRLDVLYFLGCALWNYATTPYLMLQPGFEIGAGDAWTEDGETWRRLEIKYRLGFPTHCRNQSLYLDDVGRLRRPDYTASVFGGMARAAHHLYDHKSFDGLLNATHRVVYLRLPGGRPVRWRRAMEGWIDDVRIM